MIASLIIHSRSNLLTTWFAARQVWCGWLKAQHRYSARFAAMLQDKLHVFFARFSVSLSSDVFHGRTSNGSEIFSSFFMPWHQQICMAKCPYSRDDLPKILFKITAQVCKKSTSNWRTSLTHRLRLVNFFLCFVQLGAQFWKCLRHYFGLSKWNPRKKFSMGCL